MGTTNREAISEADEMTLIGIAGVAANLRAQLDHLVKMAADLTGEELDGNNYGHAADFVWSEMAPAELLKRLSLQVSKGGEVERCCLCNKTKKRCSCTIDDYMDALPE